MQNVSVNKKTQLLLLTAHSCFPFLWVTVSSGELLFPLSLSLSLLLHAVLEPRLLLTPSHPVKACPRNLSLGIQEQKVAKAGVLAVLAVLAMLAAVLKS